MLYALKKAFNERLNKLYKLRVFTEFELNLFYDLGVSYNTLVMVFLTGKEMKGHYNYY